jgi:hypothetical protein
LLEFSTMRSTSRRSFLKVAGVSLFAGGVAPAVLGAEDKSGARPVVIGDGEHRYECHHNWGQVPSHVTWKNTHGTAVDADGLIYITHQGQGNAPCDTVVVFDSQGKFVRSFGKEYAGSGHGIDIRNEDGTEYLYLSATAPARTVIKCDKKGEVVWKKTAPVEPHVYDEKHPFSPTNVCFGTSGELYVGDGYGSSFIHEYGADGKWIRSWGGAGKEAGKMRTPHGQWLDNRPGREPRLAIADRANARIQYFSLDGKPVEVLQGVPAAQKEKDGTTDKLAGENGIEIPVTYVYGISFPADVDTRNDLMLVPDLHARIMIFNAQNKLLVNLGLDEDWTAKVLEGKPFKIRTQPQSWVAGKFVHPHDACFDHDGNIFVAEWVDQGRVSFLKRV